MTGHTVAIVAIVGEDTAHAVLAGSLLRQIVPDGEWVFDGDLELDTLVSGLRYHRQGSLKPPQSKLRGHIDGQPAGPRVQVARNRMVSVLERRPTLMIYVEDTDGDDDVPVALQRAALSFAAHSAAIILAMPHRDAEAWFVAGYLPSGIDDRQRLTSLRKSLSFDPTTNPERLSARPNSAPQDAKRVLRQLLGLGAESKPLSIEELDRERYHERLLGDPARLRQHGRACGLTDYLDALTTRASPALRPATSTDP